MIAWLLLLLLLLLLLAAHARMNLLAATTSVLAAAATNAHGATARESMATTVWHMGLARAGCWIVQPRARGHALLRAAGPALHGTWQAKAAGAVTEG